MQNNKPAPQVIPSNYYPRPLQEKLHRLLKRFNVLVFHRRFGKTVFTVNEIKARGLQLNKFNPQYAYIAPTFAAAKRIAWDMFKEYLKNIPDVKYNESELTITIERPWLGDRVKIWLAGAENYDALRGIYLDGVVLDEYAMMSPSIWGTVIRPALSDREGWAIFISTPKGTNHFYNMYKQAQDPENQADWFSALYKASETEIIPHAELEAARRTMSEEEFLQEYECDFFSANTGTYFGKYISRAERENRITEVPYVRSALVDTFWDIGIGDTTVIWFRQRINGKEKIIDHLETSGVGLEWYVGELVKRGYVYGEHVFPHDMTHQEFGSGKTRLDMLVEFFASAAVGGKARVLERHRVDDGINAVRMILDQCEFDKHKCQRGIDALKAYSKKWDDKNAIFSEKPKHDWASHSADAFRVFAMGKRDRAESVGVQEYVDQIHSVADNGYDIFGGR